ncbi:hypothetical protein PLESTB_000948500 [Pleodorina starrii]|uniref:Vacuolar protein 8 n=1 Tax=Pleodorina starrii TaxID=330485 RepID=A0A9W6BN81_9CHLO|nr:homolog of minus gamete specific protein [Pleodorina starrii]GLC55143.1 hypothetical protein PLESTB_000948500 [Pleodorina starrii]
MPEGRPTGSFLHATRREKDAAYEPHDNHDEGLEEVVGNVTSLDREESIAAVTKLWEMTALTRRNCKANQIALADLGGITLMLDYAVARTNGQPTTDDEDAANMALLVLENLSSNVQLHREMAQNTSLLAFLVAVMSKQQQRLIRSNAAKVLVNLTFSSPQLQDFVARAGAVPAALDLLRESEPALVRQGAWLLSHLTAGQGCMARETLGAQLDVLECLRDMLAYSEDPITKARVCELVCNLARGDAESHTKLVRVGVVPMLLKLIDPGTDHRHAPEVVAPALLALAALVAAGGMSVVGGAELESRLVPHLAGILDYSNLVTGDSELSQVLMAAHTLIFALAPFVAKGKALAGITGLPNHVKELLQESGYISFQQSLSVLGLEQPQYVAASLGKDLGGPHCFVANATHQVNVELLPLLRHDNAHMVTNACARLYQIATCLREHPEGRLVLTNGSLVVALRDLLDSEHSDVLQAALSLVDALGGIPELVPLLVDSGIMDAVNSLSDQQPVAALASDQRRALHAGSAAPNTTEEPLPAQVPHVENPQPPSPSANGNRGDNVESRNDPLIKLLAERTLVTMFLAQIQGHYQENILVHDGQGQ